jgi:hypothetical protein
MQTIGQRLVWAARAELALALSDHDLTLDITNRLIASAANLSNERVTPALGNCAVMPWRRFIAQRKLKRCCEPPKKLRMHRGCDHGSGG